MLGLLQPGFALPNIFLGPLALGDVTADPCDPDDEALFVLERGAGPAVRDCSAVFRQHMAFQLGVSVLERPLNGGGCLCMFLLGHKREGGLVGKFLCGIAGDDCQALVPPRQVALKLKMTSGTASIIW